MAICKKEHRYLNKLANLPEDQGGQGRHLCAGCAYEAGLIDGLNRQSKRLDFSELDESQAGAVRHRSTEAAYDKGYASGITLP
jgi:hypothetical protein